MMKRILCLLWMACVITGLAYGAAPPFIEPRVKAKVTLNVEFGPETKVYMGKKPIKVKDMPEEGNFKEFHVKDGKVIKIVLEPDPDL